ncbi:YheC/YheD family protein [Tumebacillus sp. ITR2]|uniref:YheC/YheD family protein n=1 Tax=Tumebacillus amylolyticus TaxID=2801339 RepID=A0ABS1J7P8_9BACL|nr:YheC/YheD family protein [Tumebacillus amylolyticus]MBL0386242.1 YheC/YheD family protein [Tumebacillus amylolyticus]
MNLTQPPILGVLTTTVPSQDQARSRLTSFSPKAIWHHFARAAHERGLSLCLFRPEDISPRKQTVLGYFNHDGENWTRMTGRLPDIVYDNVYVHLANRPAVRRARRFFLKQGKPLFNPRLGNKIQLADWLHQYPNLWKHHPETQNLTHEEQVFSLLDSVDTLYLKPINGSAGQGILEISETSQGRYAVRAAKFSNTKKPLDVELTRDEVQTLVRRQIKLHKFILQQGIPLLHIDGGKIDLRTHLQRNLHGEWEQVALIVKRGQPYSIVSNYHAGGSKHDWAWLQDWARQQKVKLPDREEVEDLSKRIARAYADKAPHLASIGLDLGIDHSGNLWLLDVNARPGRNILDNEQKKRCFELHAEFAAFLLQEKSR